MEAELPQPIRRTRHQDAQGPGWQLEPWGVGDVNHHLAALPWCAKLGEGVGPGNPVHSVAQGRPGPLNYLITETSVQAQSLVQSWARSSPYGRLWAQVGVAYKGSGCGSSSRSKQPVPVELPERHPARTLSSLHLWASWPPSACSPLWLAPWVWSGYIVSLGKARAGRREK